LTPTYSQVPVFQLHSLSVVPSLTQLSSWILALQARVEADQAQIGLRCEAVLQHRDAALVAAQGVEVHFAAVQIPQGEGGVGGLDELGMVLGLCPQCFRSQMHCFTYHQLANALFYLSSARKCAALPIIGSQMHCFFYRWLANALMFLTIWLECAAFSYHWL
jgi:hypothetical protein